MAFTLLGSVAGLRAEDKARTLDVLRTYSREINRAAEAFHVPARLLAAAIYADRRMHYNLLDHSLDVVIARQGRNNSIGIAQVRVSTALWICRVLGDSTSMYHPGGAACGQVLCTDNRDTVIAYLSDSRKNLLFAAAYSAMLLERWQRAGFDLQGNVEVFATLYNLGPYRGDGSERQPHSNPESNEYGYVARDFYVSSHLLEVFPAPSTGQ